MQEIASHFLHMEKYVSIGPQQTSTIWFSWKEMESNNKYEITFKISSGKSQEIAM